jgi:DNA-binding NarL/FixJ family response regulator
MGHTGGDPNRDLRLGGELAEVLAAGEKESDTKEEERNIMYALDFQLTHREQEVLHLVAEGYTDRRIAQSLIISPRTVNRHLSNIFVKLAVPCRTAAVAYAIRLRLI